MKNTDAILFKSFVRPFYKQHAGLFIFIFIVLFGAVGVVDGAGLLHFHYSLIVGMLKNLFFLLPVMVVWLLYAKKTEQFIINSIRRPDFTFIHTLSLLDARKLFLSMFRVQILLFLPVLSYVLIVLATGISLHRFIESICVIVFIVALCIISARWYVYSIQHPTGIRNLTTVFRVTARRKICYWTYFIRYLGREKKLIYVGIKIYCCAILYLMVVNQIPFEYDLSMIIIFFSLGILGHGLLIHQFRYLEETRCRFLRTLPIPLLSRLMQYAILYFVMLIPEFITIAFLTPKFLHINDGVQFALLAYLLLISLNSLLFIRFFRMKDYLKIMLLIFFMVFTSVLMHLLPIFFLLLLISSVIIFYKRFYFFESGNHGTPESR